MINNQPTVFISHLGQAAALVSCYQYVPNLGH
jgi:hypothetical protein